MKKYNNILSKLSLSTPSLLGKVGLGLLFLFCSIFAQAQTEKTGRYSAFLKAGNQKSAVEISFGSLPVLHNPLYPVITAGVERNYLNTNRSRLYQSASLSYFHDTYTSRDWSIVTNLGYEFRVFKGLYLGASLGVGYQRSRRADIVYTYENERWVGKANSGIYRNRTQIEGNGELGYRFGRYSVFGGYKYQLLLNYDKQLELPLFLQKAPMIGVRVGL